MKRPKSAQAQKLSARNREDFLEQKLSPNRPTDQKQSLTKTIKLKVQQNNNDIGDDNQITRSDLFTRKKSDHFNMFTSIQHKVRLQQNEIDILKQQVQLQQRLAENIPKDYELQIQQYEVEINRLQSFLDEALSKGSEPKKNQILGYLSKIQEQKGEINRLKLLNDNLQRELEKLQTIVKKQQEQLMKGNQQIYKKQINQNDNQNNDDIKTIQHQHQFNQLLQEKDKKLLELTKNQQQNQIKLNSYMQNVDQLNSQLQAKQNVIKILEAENEKLKEEQKYLEDQLQEQQENINELTQDNQQIQQNLQLKEQKLNNLIEKGELEKQSLSNKKKLSFLQSVSYFDYYKYPQQIKKSQKHLAFQNLQNVQIIYRIQKKDVECQCDFIILNQKKEQNSQEQFQNQNQYEINKKETKNLLIQKENQKIIDESNVIKQKDKDLLTKNELEKEIISEIVPEYLSSFLSNHETSQNKQKSLNHQDELVIAKQICDQYLNSYVSNFSTEYIQIVELEVENYLQQFIEKSNL